MNALLRLLNWNFNDWYVCQLPQMYLQPLLSILKETASNLLTPSGLSDRSFSTCKDAQAAKQSLA